ncbi:hypothetical protein [Nesterenkonia pannonica]|uniref:hypothetical protein n=1 Tax=Nesterenkonia pannonica TaxID=1548602 RepID=UPI002164C889|nr:hypothetical protein [Nesterenkonia pannonica]
MTLPRWLLVTWPGIEQTVVDYEPELVAFVLEHLPMAPRRGASSPTRQRRSPRTSGTLSLSSSSSTFQFGPGTAAPDQ